MLNRLHTWLLAAVALALGFGLALMGTGLLRSWAVLLALVQVPAVLATLLLLRACWLRARGRPTGLLVGNREVMTGVGAFLIPAAVLAAWVVARESGTITANLYATAGRTDSTHTWNRTSQAPAFTIPVEAGVTVEGPDGAVLALLRGALQGIAVRHDDIHVAVRVKADFEEPAAWLPLWKSTASRLHTDISIMFWRGDGAAAPFCADEGTFVIEGTWSIVGFAPRGELPRFVGRAWGEALRRAVADRVQSALEDARKTTAPR